jgi:transposase
MLSVTPATRVFLALAPVDMRKSFNGLYTLAKEQLAQEPTSGHLFVFTNRLRNRLKILFWDGSGLWVCANQAGQPKDMAARTLLVKLEKLGRVQLPPRRQRPVNRMRQTRTADLSWDQSPCVGSIRDFQPLELAEVSRDPAARQELRSALAQFHYLGFDGAVGDYAQLPIMCS